MGTGDVNCLRSRSDAAHGTLALNYIVEQLYQMNDEKRRAKQEKNDRQLQCLPQFPLPIENLPSLLLDFFTDCIVT
jgi:hypothetical protein